MGYDIPSDHHGSLPAIQRDRVIGRPTEAHGGKPMVAGTGLSNALAIVTTARVYALSNKSSSVTIPVAALDEIIAALPR